MYLNGLPKKEALYNPLSEKDSCGVGCVVQKHGKLSHRIIEDGLTILKNLHHRGAVRVDPRSGDGSGILTQIPHHFFCDVFKEEKFKLPQCGQYGVGMFFLPKNNSARKKCIKMLNSNPK